MSAYCKSPAESASWSPSRASPGGVCSSAHCRYLYITHVSILSISASIHTLTVATIHQHYAVVSFACSPKLCSNQISTLNIPKLSLFIVPSFGEDGDDDRLDGGVAFFAFFCTMQRRFALCPVSSSLALWMASCCAISSAAKGDRVNVVINSMSLIISSLLYLKQMSAHLKHC